MLYLVATPIGNLADISHRALETLKSCDYILCEDTRHSAILLNHYQIQKPLKSYHQFNETARESHVIADLHSGMTIGLISDAGTPGISDPGAELVKKCVEENIDVVAIPGACAAITALSSSGFDTTLFQFYGFLPRKQGELKRALQQILSYVGTTICYESPHRILNVLETFNTMAPVRRLCVARELTKKFEEFRRGTAAEIIESWKGLQPKGELVLLIDGQPSESQHAWETMTPQEHVAWMESTYALSRSEAIKAVAELRGLPKKIIYKQVHGI